jgi:uncharacterized protein (TIGR02246 family)
MLMVKPMAIAALLTVLCGTAATAQGADPQGAAVLTADAAFARTVADHDRERFLSFIAETATFSGGTPNELHGRDAIIKEWAAFLTPGGPTLTWTPTRGEVLGAGDLGVTTGRSVFRSKGPDGKVVERRGQYVTVWKKQADGRWQVIYDTGSTIP